MNKTWVLLLLFVGSVSVGAWGQEVQGPSAPNVLFCQPAKISTAQEKSFFGLNAATPVFIVAKILGVENPVGLATAIVSVALNVIIGPAKNIAASAECACDEACPANSTLVSTLFLDRTIEIGQGALAPGQQRQTLSFTVPVSGDNSPSSSGKDGINNWTASFRTSSADGVNVGPIKLRFSFAVGAGVKGLSVGKSIPLGASSVSIP